MNDNLIVLYFAGLLLWAFINIVLGVHVLTELRDDRKNIPSYRWTTPRRDEKTREAKMFWRNVVLSPLYPVLLLIWGFRWGCFFVAEIRKLYR
jgi:hypothetical protein